MAGPYESVSIVEVGVFLTSLLVAVFTAIATWINYQLFRTQVEPEVVVYATPIDNEPSYIFIVIENTGKGLAKNVSFSLSRSIPRRAFGLSSEEAPEAQLMTSGPLINGIPSLGPVAKRTILWGQFGGLSKALGEGYVYVRASYHGGERRSPFRKRSYGTESVLEITSFEANTGRQNWHKKNSRQPRRLDKNYKIQKLDKLMQNFLNSSYEASPACPRQLATEAQPYAAQLQMAPPALVASLIFLPDPVNQTFT